MERPGLKRLLGDIDAGKVDVVLLYKIDRLTRSLTDFAGIVEVLDRAEAMLVYRQFIIGLTGSADFDAEQLQMAHGKADLAAATLRNRQANVKAELLGLFVRQVRLHEDRVAVELNLHAISPQFGLDVSPSDHEPSIIRVPAIRVRRGHQLRLIIPGQEDAHSKPTRRDDKLLGLIAEAQQAKEIVFAMPESSLTSIAREHGRCRTRLGKPVALSCLAPDLVTAIVKGKQPEHLTAVRLMSKPLPLSWTEQRKELGLS